MKGVAAMYVGNSSALPNGITGTVTRIPGYDDPTSPNYRRWRFTPGYDETTHLVIGDRHWRPLNAASPHRTS